MTKFEWKTHTIWPFFQTGQILRYITSLPQVAMIPLEAPDPMTPKVLE